MKCDIFDYINVCRIESFLVKLYNQVTSFQAHSAQFSIPQPSHIARGFSFWVPLQIWSAKLSSGFVIVQKMWWKKLYILGFEKSFFCKLQNRCKESENNRVKNENKAFLLKKHGVPSCNMWLHLQYIPNYIYIVITIKYIHTLIYIICYWQYKCLQHLINEVECN